MTKQQALDLITQVLVTYKGTLQEHQLLHQALELVKNLEEPVVKEETKK